MKKSASLTEVVLTFPAGKQLVFTGRTELLYKKNFPVDGQTRQSQSTSQPACLFAQYQAVNKTPSMH